MLKKINNDIYEGSYEQMKDSLYMMKEHMGQMHRIHKDAYSEGELTKEMEGHLEEIYHQFVYHLKTYWAITRGEKHEG